MTVYQTNKDEKYFSIARPELLMMVDQLSKEKFIEKEEVIEAVETALLKAAYQRYGYDRNISVRINPKNGAIEIWCLYEVVDNKIDPEEFNENRQMLLKDAKKIIPKVEIGDTLETILPPIEFGRSSFQSVKQIVTQRIKAAVKAKEYEEFKDQVGTIVNGTVKRIEYGNIFVDIKGKAEGYIRRDELIPRETLHTGDRIRAYIYEVKEDPHGPQILLSRTHPQFLAKLFEQEVPEIYEGVIEIKAVARDPGSKAKVAVFSEDQTLDPVGAAVGMRGVRVQSIVNELQGEKIDVIQWSNDIAELAINTIGKIKVTKVVLDEDVDKIELVVPEDQLSMAIGRRGQNVRLASQITGTSVDILTEEEEAKRREEEVKIKSKLFIEALNVDDVIARFLIAEGFSSLEEIAYVPVDEIKKIEGFDDDLAKEIQDRAKSYLEEAKKKLEESMSTLKIKEDLKDFPGIRDDFKIKLGENKVRSLDDLADLSSDELIEILGEDNLTEKEANKIIMKAREHWFENETEEEAESEETEEKEETEENNDEASENKTNDNEEKEKTEDKEKEDKK